MKLLALFALALPACMIDGPDASDDGRVTIDSIARTAKSEGFTIAIDVTNHTNAAAYVYAQSFGDSLDAATGLATLVMHEVPPVAHPGVVVADCHVMIPNIAVLAPGDTRELAVSGSEQLATAAALEVELGWSDRPLELTHAQLVDPKLCGPDAARALQRLESGVAIGIEGL